MSPKTRGLLLVAIMSGIAVGVTGITLMALYSAAFEEQKARLMETAQSQARLIEAIARHEQLEVRRPQGLYPHDDPFTATLQTLRESHAQFEGFGKTGEFTLARHQGDLIVFLLNHRHVELADRKEPCGRRRVGRLMEEMGLVAIQPRSFKPRTTDSRHTLGYSPNLLINAPPPDGINQIWVGDITYVPLVGGDFLYGSDGVGEDKATENGVPVPLLSVPTEEAETG